MSLLASSYYRERIIFYNHVTSGEVPTIRRYTFNIIILILSKLYFLFNPDLVGFNKDFLNHALIINFNFESFTFYMKSLIRRNKSKLYSLLFVFNLREKI